MPNRCHDVSENAKLIKVSHLNAQFKCFLYLYICQLENKSYTLETIAHELRQIIVEMLINYSQIVFEVMSNLVQVEEDLGKVLFYERQQAHQFHVAEATHDVVGYGVELITDKERELHVELAQHIVVGLTTARHRHLLQFNLPVTENSFNEEVEANEELNNLVVLGSFLDIKAVSKVINFEDFSRQSIHLLLLEQIHEKLVLINRLK